MSNNLIEKIGNKKFAMVIGADGKTHIVPDTIGNLPKNATNTTREIGESVNEELKEKIKGNERTL